MVEPNIKIICPSRGRAGFVTTHKAITGITLCVAKSQAPAYREHYPDIEIVEHDDELEAGTYLKKLQWIYEYFGDVFYVDDDIEFMVRLYAGRGEQFKVEPGLAEKLVYNACDIAREMGCYLFGFNTQPDIRNYNGLQPFRMRGMLWGNGLGMLKGSKLYWNTNIRTNEDFWLVLLNAYHHRFVFADDRFGWKTKDTFKNPGGAAFYRTAGLEEEAYRQLRGYFGDAIRLKKDTARAKRKHEFQPTLNLPF